MKLKWSEMSPLTRVLCAIAFVNFFSVIASVVLLGGSALGGAVEDGHYFVRHKGHRSEVSAAVWRYSLIHTLSLFITHPAAMIAMFFDWGRKGG